MTTEHLVENYLHRLEAAAGDLPRARRTELVQEIREHIDHGLDETGHDEVSIRNVLERLGPPEEIVAAAKPPAPLSRPGRLEFVAVFALLIPFIGWILGPVLIAFSQVWSSREKTIGIALALLPILLPFVAGATPISGPFDFLLLFVMLVTALPSAIYLAWRLRAGPGPV